MNRKKAIEQTDKVINGYKGRFQPIQYMFVTDDINSIIKKSINEGKYKCQEHFYDLTRKTVEAIIKHYTKKGFTIKYELQISGFKIHNFYISWEPKEHES